MTRLKSSKEIISDKLLITQQTDLAHCRYINPITTELYVLDNMELELQGSFLQRITAKEFLGRHWNISCIK